MSKTVAQAIVMMLEQAGVQRCYGIPGDTLNYFTDAVRQSGLRWVHTRHEEVAGFAAGADSLLTGQLTACAGSCGPGSLHFVNGLFESHRNGSPVVLIASQVDSPALQTAFPQEVDFVSIYQQYSVYCSQISSPEEVYTKTQKAIHAALSKRGLAVLVLPVNISKLSAPKGGVPKFRLPLQAVIQPTAADLQKIADILCKSSKVTVFAGYGCKEAREEVLALAAKLKAPVVRTSRAKDFLEYDNPFDCGMTGLMGHASGCNAILDCETLLLLGTGFAWSQFYPKNATVIQVDSEISQLGKRCPVEIGVVGTVKDTLQALVLLLAEKEDGSFLEKYRKEYSRSFEHYSRHAVPEKNGMIRPQYLASTISKHATSDAVFTADGGTPLVWMLRHIQSTATRRTLGSLVHGTMANAFPQALGIQAAYPGRQVIALSGDGGCAMLLGDLLTAVQEQLPIKVVVFNNSSLFFVELEQRVEGLLDSYTNLENPDFSGVAKAMGLWGKRIKHCSELEEAVSEWLAQPGPALLDVLVDKELVMPPKINLEQAAGMALYGAKALLDGRSDDLLNMIKENV